MFLNTLNQLRQRKTRLCIRSGFMANRYDFRYGEMNCNHWLRCFNHAEFMLCRRLHKLCKQFAILQNGPEIKKLSGMFSSLILFIVDISLNHVLPPLPEVSSFWSWRSHQPLQSAQSSFSLTS